MAKKKEEPVVATGKPVVGAASLLTEPKIPDGIEYPIHVKHGSRTVPDAKGKECPISVRCDSESDLVGYLKAGFVL